MRQAPTYLVIGSGRMARHFSNYLKLLNLSFKQWSRSKNSFEQLKEFSQNCSHVLLLISDSAIEEFVETHSWLAKKRLVHCSGSLVLKNIFGAHPLMSFGSQLYDLDTYKNITFILEDGSPSLANLFPGLPNKSFKIPTKLKPFYHSLCVMSGNFTCLLWQKFFKELQETFNLPKEVAHLYLEQITKNLKFQSKDALTGPFSRNDKKTIAANLKALEDDPYQEVYQAFIKLLSSNNEVVYENS
jgi:2-dehydropantoate 2-reductase